MSRDNAAYRLASSRIASRRFTEVFAMMRSEVVVTRPLRRGSETAMLP